jgi:NADH:ubiquinone oxidoreductase subunit 3 (subunit A)
MSTDNESILEKYWIYIIFVVVFAVLVILALLLSLFIGGSSTKKVAMRDRSPYFSEFDF